MKISSDLEYLSVSKKNGDVDKLACVLVKKSTSQYYLVNLRGKFWDEILFPIKSRQIRRAYEISADEFSKIDTEEPLMESRHVSGVGIGIAVIIVNHFITPFFDSLNISFLDHSRILTSFAGMFIFGATLWFYYRYLANQVKSNFMFYLADLGKKKRVTIKYKIQTKTSFFIVKCIFFSGAFIGLPMFSTNFISVIVDAGISAWLILYITAMAGQFTFVRHLLGYKKTVIVKNPDLITIKEEA